MKKKLLLVLAIGFTFLIAWYFLIKEYDYQVTFKTNHSPGAVYSTLVAWNNWKPASKKVVSTISKVPFSEIKQDFFVGDSIITIHWKLESKNDSVTKVNAKFKDKSNSFIQKLKIPFSDTDFVKRSIATAKKIRQGLHTHQNDYNLSAIETTTLKEKNCAYITLTCKLNEKAKTMMKHTIKVMEYIRGNDLELVGNPFLEVTNWDTNMDVITFDFCFPIHKKDSYPYSEKVKIKTSAEQKVIKTMFNGDYRISDRAWFKLIDYSERHHIKVKELPVEVYLNDPHSGGNELEWEAEVYLPIKE